MKTRPDAEKAQDKQNIIELRSGRGNLSDAAKEAVQRSTNQAEYGSLKITTKLAVRFYALTRIRSYQSEIRELDALLSSVIRDEDISETVEQREKEEALRYLRDCGIGAAAWIAFMGGMPVLLDSTSALASGLLGLL